MGGRKTEAQNEMHFIDTDDDESQDTKNARRNMEVHMDAAMPCKKNTKNLTCLPETLARLGAPSKVPKTKYACAVESHESTRQRVGSSPQKGHVDHIARKGHTSMNHYNLVQIFAHAESNDSFGRQSSTGKRMDKA